MRLEGIGIGVGIGVGHQRICTGHICDVLGHSKDKQRAFLISPKLVVRSDKVKGNAVECSVVWSWFFNEGGSCDLKSHHHCH